MSDKLPVFVRMPCGRKVPVAFWEQLKERGKRTGCPYYKWANKYTVTLHAMADESTYPVNGDEVSNAVESTTMWVGVLAVVVVVGLRLLGWL